MSLNFLDFEQPIAELEAKIDSLTAVSRQDEKLDINIDEEVHRLREKSVELTRKIFADLGAWQVAQLARHPRRPYTLDYVRLADDYIIVYTAGHGHERTETKIIEKLDSDEARAHLGDEYDRFVDQLELVQGACHEFNQQEFLDGQLTPVFFGTALGNFGVDHVLDAVVDWAPKPLARVANERTVEPVEEKFTGFVFKIQANMDPKHRDRIAFMRICSGKYEKGMKMRHVRTGKDVRIGDALTFFSSEREQLEEAFAGDIIGLHNHGTIQIGDTFTEGESLSFTGIPHFAPELFRRVRLRDPLKSKQLRQGLQQLAEEGATQVFFPERSNDIILGAVGVLLFLCSPRQLFEQKAVYAFLSLAVNILRSLPFIILLIVMIPFTVLITGTSLGVAGAIPPLVVGATPFFARLVETALREVDRGIIEATQAMGASTRQIITSALLPEARPGIFAAITVTAITLVSYTAMAGVVGAGGLGDLAIRFGYQRFQTDVMIVTVVLLLILVQILQTVGDRLVVHFSRK